jgi:hypothetical protein
MSIVIRFNRVELQAGQRFATFAAIHSTVSPLFFGTAGRFASIRTRLERDLLSFYDYVDFPCFSPRKKKRHAPPSRGMPLKLSDRSIRR